MAGTEFTNLGYGDQASILVPRYERLPFERVHAGMLDLLPTEPSNIIDIGAGTGRDAAYFSRLGHNVLAVEPTDELREPGKKLHADLNISWLKDGLPKLERVLASGETFDLVMITAVWMHLDAPQRALAMSSVASLMSAGARLILSLRHGPVPAGRRMFEVSASETTTLARSHGLKLNRARFSESIQQENKAAGVSWTKLAYDCA